MKINLVLTFILSSLMHAGLAFATASLGCLIEPSQIAQVGSQVVGVTETVNVERGDTVKKGQILATLKADYEKANVDIAKTRSQLEADVRSAEANLELARITEKRGVDLVEKKFLSQQSLDKSHAETVLAEQRLAFAREQLRISSGELNVARAQLSLRSIRAPFDGIVAERFVWPGERVEDKPLFKVVKISPLRVEIVAPVELYGQVEKSQIIQIKPDLANTVTVDAKVILVDKVIDGASNTFRIRAEIDNQAAEIPSGLRCKATIAPNTVAKNMDTVPKVSDGTATSRLQSAKKHSFELKPLSELSKSNPQQPNQISDKRSAGVDVTNATVSQQLVAKRQESAPSSQQTAKMGQSTFMSSGPSKIKGPSDKNGMAKSSSTATTALSIEHQFKQLQVQREALKNGRYRPTSIDIDNRKNNFKPTTLAVAYQPVAAQSTQYTDGVAYPAALEPKAIKQLVPMPTGLRRVTYLDAGKTFPIRRVVTLSPGKGVIKRASDITRNTDTPSEAGMINKGYVDLHAQAEMKDDLGLKLTLKLERTLSGFLNTSAHSQSN